jgi:hypothetical protein
MLRTFPERDYVLICKEMENIMVFKHLNFNPFLSSVKKVDVVFLRAKSNLRHFNLMCCIGFQPIY